MPPGSNPAWLNLCFSATIAHAGDWDGPGLEALTCRRCLSRSLKLGSKKGLGIDCEDHGLRSKRLGSDCEDESQEFRNKALGPVRSRECARFCIVNSAKLAYSRPVEPGLRQAIHNKLRSWRIINFGLINRKSVCAPVAENEYLKTGGSFPPCRPPPDGPALPPIDGRCSSHRGSRYPIVAFG